MIILDNPVGSNVIIKVLIKGRQEGESREGDGMTETEVREVRERSEDVMLVAFKMEKGT